uniref:E3 ubiquitin protein ligase DRIP2-like n=1 Tax=Fragaria vesca subsp. vesca TaxID=101020 RepID=UPI0005CA8E6F|nr:PREDICTED: E3 ubiquitin protein ligase DRIP2-like [Fragaria vesca subsp. vesca]XP_011467755.1 PREDICTED: E3 ubiquitin protein ligase DRIP2-like [Fragaria vesca subsp. vesca]
MMTISSNHVVKVKREKLEACMTCPVCNELFREATTISECLHTFCKRCIYDKIINEDCDRCPVCKTDLGVAPMEKLRADNSLEDIRAKIFPSESKKLKARVADHNLQVVDSEKVLPSETRNAKTTDVGLPSIYSSGRKKQRFLSSLGTSTTTATTSGKRYFTRKSSVQHESHLLTREELVPKHEKFPERIKSSENLREYSTYARQNATEKLFKKDEVNNDIMNKAQPRWTTGLMETEREDARVLRKQVFLNLNNEPEELNTFQEHGNNNESIPAPLGSLPIAKGQRGHKRKVVPDPEELQTPAQHVVFDANIESEPRSKPIWFSLQAYPWEGYAPLPQIPSSYLRVKDGNLPSSFIKKYLVRKLHLQSEAEVEILMWGRPIHPTLLLHDLVDLWLQKISASNIIQSTVGSSAKECVMVITYCRKVLHRW